MSIDTIGKIENWTDNASIHRVIELIEDNITLFIEKYTGVHAEKDLNQNFSLCMNTKAKDELFTFSNEYKDIILATPHKVDFGVVIDGETEAFFVLEAKRLNTSLPKAREKEYIVGKLGGIERFKKEKHGKSLTHVGMIAYVQTDNSGIWLDKINDWIDEEITSPTSSELTWVNKDKLVIDKEEAIYSTYSSTHQCLTKDINMYHVWIDLT